MCSRSCQSLDYSNKSPALLALVRGPTFGFMSMHGGCAPESRRIKDPRSFMN